MVPKKSISEPTRGRSFSALYLKSLRAKELRYFASDPLVPGLRLVIETSGSKSWQFRFMWEGKRTKLALGSLELLPLADARARVLEVRKLMSQGIDPRRANVRPDRPAMLPATTGQIIAPNTVLWLSKEFMERFIRPARKRPETVQRILDVDVLPYWGQRDVRTITPRDIVALLDRIVERGSRTMANRIAAVVGQLFKFAVHRTIIEASPVQLLYSPGGTETPRDRVLSDAELKALLRNLDKTFIRAPQTAAMIRIALLTACRRSEAALAKWSDINFKTGVWTIPAEHAKHGNECIVALVPEAIAVLRALQKRAAKSAWVMPAEEGEGPADPKLLTRSLARHTSSLAKIGVQPFVLHDLRRTARTGLAKLGTLPHIAEAVLNHRAPGVVPVYDRYSYLPEKREALTKWAAHLAQIEASE
jgi:integrase